MVRLLNKQVYFFHAVVSTAVAAAHAGQECGNATHQ